MHLKCSVRAEKIHEFSVPRVTGVESSPMGIQSMNAGLRNANPAYILFRACSLAVDHG